MTNTGTEAADQIVNMSLKGTEMALKLTGTGAKHLALLLIALLKDNKKFKGRTTLTRMLRDGKELSVFRIDSARLKEFAAEAKRYGVLFTAIHDRKHPQKEIDVMVRAEDAGKINRIVERLKLTAVDMGKIKADIEQTRRSARAKENPTRERSARFSEKSARSQSASASSRNAALNRSNDKPSIRQRILEIKTERAVQQTAPSIKTPVIIPKPKAR